MVLVTFAETKVTRLAGRDPHLNKPSRSDTKLKQKTCLTVGAGTHTPYNSSTTQRQATTTASIDTSAATP